MSSGRPTGGVTYIRPSSGREQKIDAAIALMMAMGRAMMEDEDAKGLEGFLTSPIFG
jgi:phage terminase large subunit-like protein